MRLAKTLFKYLQSPVFTKGLQDWKAKGKYFNFVGSDIFYLDEKGQEDGESALVLLHGFPANSYDWREMWPGLRARFKRLIAPDLFGFGFSAKPIRDYKIADQAQMIESLIEELGVKKCHIFAHNYGDTVAQELLARYNEKQGSDKKTWEMQSLCFTNGGIFSETHKPLEVQIKVAKKFMGYFYAYQYFYSGVIFRNIGKIFGPNTQPSEEMQHDMWCSVRHNRGVKIQPLLLTYMAQRKQFRERWVGAMQTTDVPLHIIYGDADPINPPPFVDHYRSMVPKSGVTVLKDIGHWPNLEAPDKVLAAYLNFVENTGGTREHT